MVHRSDLHASMSHYLIERIDHLPNVELHMNTEVIALLGNATRALAGRVFHHCLIGADPHIGWLQDCVVRSGSFM